MSDVHTTCVARALSSWTLALPILGLGNTKALPRLLRPGLWISFNARGYVLFCSHTSRQLFEIYTKNIFLWKKKIFFKYVANIFFQAHCKGIPNHMSCSVRIPACSQTCCRQLFTNLLFLTYLPFVLFTYLLPSTLSDHKSATCLSIILFTYLLSSNTLFLTCLPFGQVAFDRVFTWEAEKLDPTQLWEQLPEDMMGVYVPINHAGTP